MTNVESALMVLNDVDKEGHLTKRWLYRYRSIGTSRRSIPAPRDGCAGSPSLSIARTFTDSFQIPGYKRRALTKVSKRVYRNPISLAREWQRKLDNVSGTSRAGLARTYGISRARVTQVFQLLDLSPEVLDTVIALGDPLREAVVTERSLRLLVGRPAVEQCRRLNSLLAR